MAQTISMKTKINPDERFGYTDIQGASRISGLSISTIYKLVASRKIPHYKPTGRLLFKIVELEQWIEQSHCAVIS